MDRLYATRGRQEGAAVNRGGIPAAVRARPYRPLTVEDLKVLLDGHDPTAPVLLRERSGGLLALNNIESRTMLRREAVPGSRAEPAIYAIVLACPADDAVDAAPAVDLPGRLVSLISSFWLRIGAYGAGNIHRQFHRLDCDDDQEAP
jgi:hypothetical protein